mmetsp:Transcript_22068/g.58081  ORF Transcript_22068/g.58081 Transcript_22068/m.58081 type:complete len:339 (+) Transcript_22068:221-1237(+)
MAHQPNQTSRRSALCAPHRGESDMRRRLRAHSTEDLAPQRRWLRGLEQVGRAVPPRAVVGLDLLVDTLHVVGAEIEQDLQHARQLDVLLVFGVAVHLDKEGDDDILEVFDVEMVGHLGLALGLLELLLEQPLLPHEVLHHLVRLAQHLAQRLELRPQLPHLLVALRLVASNIEHLPLGRSARLELRRQLGHTRLEPRRRARVLRCLAHQPSLRGRELLGPLGARVRLRLPLGLPSGHVLLARRERRLQLRQLCRLRAARRGALLASLRQLPLERRHLSVERTARALGLPVGCLCSLQLLREARHDRLVLRRAAAVGRPLGLLRRRMLRRAQQLLLRRE